MKVRDLKLILNDLPDDMEIVRDEGGSVYGREICFEVTKATVHKAELNNPTEYTDFYRESCDDYLSFYRVNTDVLLIY